MHVVDGYVARYISFCLKWCSFSVLCGCESTYLCGCRNYTVVILCMLFFYFSMPSCDKKNTFLVHTGQVRMWRFDLTIWAHTTKTHLRQPQTLNQLSKHTTTVAIVSILCMYTVLHTVKGLHVSTVYVWRPPKLDTSLQQDLNITDRQVHHSVSITNVL